MLDQASSLLRRWSVEDWPYEADYEPLMQGDILHAYHAFLDAGVSLAVMPITRLHLETTIPFPSAITFYPPGVIDLGKLNVIPNRHGTTSLAELGSAASGITCAVLGQHPLIVFPCKVDWQTFRRSNHEGHLEIIRWMSEAVDRCCLNFVRYRSCSLELFPDEWLPAHAGQIASNHMMAGALLYSGALREARIIGGAAFSYFLTRGLGMPLKQLERDTFPRDGEVGRIVNHALSLYATLLEAANPTVRFMQSMSLLEFLADPD